MISCFLLSYQTFQSLNFQIQMQTPNNTKKETEDYQADKTKRLLNKKNELFFNSFLLTQPPGFI